MKNTGFVSCLKSVVAFAALISVASMNTGCRRPDTDLTQELAGKPADYSNLNVHGSCVARAPGFLQSPQLQASLCANASSTEPVDCFKKAKKENLDDAAAVEKCKSKK